MEQQISISKFLEQTDNLLNQSKNSSLNIKLPPQIYDDSCYFHNDALRIKQTWIPSAIEQNKGDGLSDQEIDSQVEKTSILDDKANQNTPQNCIDLCKNYSQISVEYTNKFNKQTLNADSSKISEQAIELDFKKFKNSQKRKTTVLTNTHDIQERTDNYRKSRFEKDENENSEREDKVGLFQFLLNKQKTLNKQYHIFMRTINIKKFMSIMRLKSRKLLFKCLSLHHFSIIGDNASDYDYYLFNNLLYKQQYFTKRFYPKNYFFCWQKK